MFFISTVGYYQLKSKSLKKLENLVLTFIRGTFSSAAVYTVTKGQVQVFVAVMLS